MTREHTPKPGVTWEQHLVRTETIVDRSPDDTSTPGMNEPLPPQPNRKTRRAQARKARRTK